MRSNLLDLDNNMDLPSNQREPIDPGMMAIGTEGIDAYLYGLPLAANPHFGAKAAIWQLGWRSCLLAHTEVRLPLN